MHIGHVSVCINFVGHIDSCMFPYCWAQCYMYVFVLLGMVLGVMLRGEGLFMCWIYR